MEIFAQGWAGVPLFFVLSGFLMARLYRSDLGKPNVRGTLQFYWRRIVRIYPAYLLVAVSAIVYQQLVLGSRSGWVWLANLSLTHQFFGLFQTNLIGPFWTLSVEAAFYAIFPLLIWLYELSYRRLGIFGTLLTLILTTAIGLLFGWALAPAKPTEWMFMRDWPYMTIFGHQFTFGAGIVAAYILERIGRQDWYNRQITGLVFIGAGLAVFGGVLALKQTSVMSNLLSGLQGSFFNMIDAYLFALCAVCLVLGLCQDNQVSRIVGSRPLVALGEASYVLYLIHHFDVWVWTMSKTQALYYFVGCNLLALAIHRWYERPIQEALRRSKTFTALRWSSMKSIGR